jgi:exopolyphosphatase/guanosine-5'-triphosphate,3'-diphosphate pyrophosphatase
LLRARWCRGRLNREADVTRYVGLAREVGPEGRLSQAGRLRARRALSELRSCLADLPPERIRVVGTASLRSLRDGSAVRAALEEVLGLPIRIISGDEEARLTFAGIVGTDPDIAGAGPALVVDLGGASTELALGGKAGPERILSFPFGCATVPAEAGPRGSLQGEQHRLQAEWGREVAAFARTGPVRAMVAPGIIGTLARLAGTPGELTREGMAHLRQALEGEGHPRALADEAIPDHHWPLLPGAWVILAFLWEELGLAGITPARAGLREGLLREFCAAAVPSRAYVPAASPARRRPRANLVRWSGRRG